MPNIKSAKKRVLVAEVRRARNKAQKSALKTEIKKAVVAIETGSEDRDALVKAAVKKIDQASAKGVLHKNTAARRKSSLAKKIGG